jgi:hypothetical protein
MTNLPIDPEMEAFFVAVALQLGTSSLPYEQAPGPLGIVMEIAEFIREHPGAPACIEKIKANYREMGFVDRAARGAIQDHDFFMKLARAYLDWIHEHSPTR